MSFRLRLWALAAVAVLVTGCSGGPPDRPTEGAISGSTSTAPPTTAPTTTTTAPTSTSTSTTTSTSTIPTTTATSTTTTTAPTSTSTSTSTTTTTIPTTTEVPFGVYSLSRHRSLRIEIAASTLPTFPAVLTHETWVAFVNEVHDIVLGQPDLMYATYAWWSDLNPRGTTVVIATRNGKRHAAAAFLSALVDHASVRLGECPRAEFEPAFPRTAPTHIAGDPLFPFAGDVVIGMSCLGEVGVLMDAWTPPEADRSILDELVEGQRGPGDLAHGIVLGAEFNPIGIPFWDIPRADWDLDPEILEEGFLIIPIFTWDDPGFVRADD